MEYKDFVEQVKEKIQDFLPEKFADASVTVHQVVKNNDCVLDGLTIRTEESNISPTVYLNPYFEQIQNGTEMDDVLVQIAATYQAHYIDHDMDVSAVTDFDNVKDKIVCKLINEEANRQFLEDKPYTKVEELAVVYFFFRDGMGEMPEELELKAGNYPDAHARMMEFLSTPDGVELVASHMDKALHQLETGEKTMRFRFGMPKEELRAELDNLLLEKKIFTTAENVEVKKEDFITQDEIDHRLGKGSGFSHGSFRIYDYFMEGHDSKDAVDFLKNEYGTGGSSHALAGNDRSHENHDAKGIKLEKGSIIPM